MATRGPRLIPMGGADGPPNVAVQRPWRIPLRLSSFGDAAEGFLERAGLDRGPWLAVGLAAGIGLWFVLDSTGEWLAAIGTTAFAAVGSIALWKGRADRSNLQIAVLSLAFVVALGLVLAWGRSTLIGAPAIERPGLYHLDARILEREEQLAEARVRLVLATRDVLEGEATKVRVNVPLRLDVPGAKEGARVRLAARLMPPAAPMLPGSYDFARTAWFDGLSATGALVGSISIVEPAPKGSHWLAEVQRALSGHVRQQVSGSAGGIAAAFASGDRGAISQADDDAMRDAGLTHLLSISGLHVSAVIAAAYFLALRLLALWPWLVLRIRLPLLSGLIGAGAGVGYTLLTGAEVPTVRSCIGALLVLAAMAAGREPLSMRMVAAAAAIVLALWPEALIGPSFQMSFAAVIAIVALHNAEPVKRFLAPREESWLHRMGRRLTMLFLTGLVIEVALTPVVMFHFHRAGLYGSLANVIAIPLVTFVAMPLIALALLFDSIGLGAPFWWMAGLALDGLLDLARFTAAQPGAVNLVPQMGLGTVLLFAAGALWLGLWRGRARLIGLVPIGLAGVFLWQIPAPDILISGDGHHVGVAGENDRLLVLRDGSEYARENLLEVAGLTGRPMLVSRWQGALCNEDFCTLDLVRTKRRWVVLIARSRNYVDRDVLVAACAAADIVIADRSMPRSCTPRWLKADRRYLREQGGLALYLSEGRIESVADHQGAHGWWRQITASSRSDRVPMLLEKPQRRAIKSQG